MQLLFKKYKKRQNVYFWLLMLRSGLDLGVAELIIMSNTGPQKDIKTCVCVLLFCLFSLEHAGKISLTPGLRKCKFTVLNVMFTYTHTHTLFVLKMNSCLICLLTCRCLWAHAGPKHGTHTSRSVRGEQKGDARDRRAAVPWPSGEVRSLEAGDVYRESARTLLLGGGVGRRGSRDINEL